ncbi:MAG: Hsp20 family protein [Blastocatellia bacterium]|nr:Hsp20 family protein [Blastocatellia bacterium]
MSRQKIKSSKPTAELQTTTETATPPIVEAESLFDRIEEINRKIEQRAYELFECRHCEHGCDLEDWLQAESEMLLPIPIEIRESDDQFAVHAEVPGFNLEEVKVGIEPRRLTIIGRTERALDQKTGEAVYVEQRFNEIFRSLDLPVDVDTEKVRATFKDGVLDLTLPKAAMPVPTDVEQQAE